MEISGRDRDELERLEAELWRQETRFDAERMNELLAEDFFEIGRSGRLHSRSDTLAVASQPILAVLPLRGFAARLLDRNLAQVTYVSAVTYDGVVEYARRSSIWSRTGTGWVLKFHQGTPTAPPA